MAVQKTTLARHPQLNRWNPACSLALPRQPEPGPPRSCNSTPQRFYRRIFWAYSGPFLAPQRNPDREQTSPHPAASTGRRSDHFGTHWDDRRDPKHTRAERVEN